MIGDLVCDCLELVLARVGIRVRLEQEVVDALELLSVDFRAGGKLEHAIEADGRFGSGFISAFSDETGPHCIMEFGIIHLW